MTSLFTLFIRGYQRFISPFLGNNCRFYPSCSEYAITAMHHHGACKGGLMTFLRLTRCHPFSEGGLDDVPIKGASL